MDEIEQLRKERDQAIAACAEMLRLLAQVNNLDPSLMGPEITAILESPNPGQRTLALLLTPEEAGFCLLRIGEKDECHNCGGEDTDCECCKKNDLLVAKLAAAVDAAKERK